MRKNQFVLALAVASLTAVTAKAQYLNTFDTSGSFTTGSRTFNPPPIWIGFDFGSATATANHSIAWTSLDAGGNAGSGSVQLGWTWNTAVDGAGSAAFTMDLLPSPGQSFVGGTLSFDLYLDPSSTPGNFNDYGFFQVIARNTDAYNFDDTGVGNGLSTFVTAPGQWTHVSIPLNATTGNLIRALTFQDFSGTDRNINGPELIDIDNLQLTPAPVPEPSTIALAGIGVAGLISIRRNRKN
jgi:hypothetical protein